MPKLNGPMVYELCQVLTNPRDGSQGLSTYDEYVSLTDAKTAAKEYLRGCKWVILEKRVVFGSEAAL